MFIYNTNDPNKQFYQASGPTPDAEKILEKYSQDPNFRVIYNSHIQNLKNAIQQGGIQEAENFRQTLIESFSSLLKGYNDPNAAADAEKLFQSAVQEAAGPTPPSNTLQQIEDNFKNWADTNHQESFYNDVIDYINAHSGIKTPSDLAKAMPDILRSLTGNSRDIYFKFPGLDDQMLKDAYAIMGASGAPGMDSLDHAYFNLLQNKMPSQFQGAIQALENELADPNNSEDAIRHYLNDASGIFMTEFYNKMSPAESQAFNQFALTNIPDWTDKSPTPPPMDFYPFNFNNNTGYPDADVKMMLVAECTNPPYYIKFDAQGIPHKITYHGAIPPDATFSLADIPGHMLNIPKDLPAARLYFSVGDGEGPSYPGGTMQNFIEFTNADGGLDMDTSCVDGVNLPLSFQVNSQNGTWNAGQPGSRADLMKALEEEYATDPVWKQMWDKNYDPNNGILSPIHTIPSDYFGRANQSGSWAEAFYQQYLNTSISMDDVGGGKWTGKVVGMVDGCPEMTFTSSDGRTVTFKVPTTNSSAIMSGDPTAWQIPGQNLPPEFASIIRDLSAAIVTNTLPTHGETLNVQYFQQHESQFFSTRSDYQNSALNFIDHYSKVLHSRGLDHREYDFAYSDELGDSSNLDLIPGSSFINGSITLGPLKQ
jgi:hypothetical protein